MRVRALFVPIVLGACSTVAPAVPSASPSAIATPSPSVAASAMSDELPPLQAQLPSRLGGVELHTFAVGQDVLDRLAANLGVTREELETAYASEHGARFLQMYAIRLAGSSANTLATALTEAAYPPEVNDVSVAQETIDGRAITVVHSPSAAPRLGTFYLHAPAETLFVVQALEREVAEEALAELP